MPTITLDIKYFRELLGFSIDDKMLEEQIAKLGFEVEEIGKDEIKIEITPNRPDLFDAVGMSRAIRNFMHRTKSFRYKIASDKPAVVIKVGDKIKKIRPFVAGMVVKDLKLDEKSLANLIKFMDKFCDTFGRDRRKIAIGMHDLSKINGPLEYDAYTDEEFIPLNGNSAEMFSEIMKINEKGIKYGDTIPSGKKRLYPALKDKEGTMALIPIINSDRTKVSVGTKSLLIDITGSSEYYVDKTADMLASLFIDMKGSVERVEIVYKGGSTFSPKMESRQMQIPISMLENEIGVRIGSNNVISLANKMGYEAALLGNKILFNVPEYRFDVINEQDIVEDVAIAYGYDYIQQVAIPNYDAGALEEKSVMISRIKDLMIGYGFSEAMNTYFTNEDTNFVKMRLQEPSNASIKLKNSRMQSITMMRTWIIPSLLGNLGKSASEKMPQRIFEIDLTFMIEEEKVHEDIHLAAVSVDPKANFNDIKAVFEGLLSMLEIKYNLTEAERKSFIQGRVADAESESVTIGFFGEVHPEVLNNFGIEEPTIGFEINLSLLYGWKASSKAVRE